MHSHIQSVDLNRAGRLINHGPTVLISARHEGVENVMSVAWCCGLDFDPPKLTVVLDKIAQTRTLVERSGRFVVQVPTIEQVVLTNTLGTTSLYEDPDKLAHAGASLFEIEGQDMPFVAGCAAWLACKVIPEPHIENEYDLFVAEVTAAWADDRVFSNGRWHFETSDPQFRTIHHVAGGQFYAIGEARNANDP